ncbi:MAG TPA: hypothetical protein VFZ21_31270 [Gemmatimonadaceae bacterium]|jgi:hypothetical protein|nr:hypothetical protein [Gemmatimonadaceae bacterium]
MRPVTVEYAKGWGYEVTFPGEAEPVEVAEADVEAEFAGRYARGELSAEEAHGARHRIAAEIAASKLEPRRGRRDRRYSGP